MAASNDTSTRRDLLGSLVAGSAMVMMAEGAAAQGQGGRPASGGAVLDLGAFLAGNGDAASAFNAALQQLAQRGGGALIVPPDNYKITRPIYLPSGVVIDLCGSTLHGGGGGTIFESGFMAGGGVASNFNTPQDTQRVIGTQVRNGKIAECDRAFNLRNFNENSGLLNIQFHECKYAVYSERPWYSRYVDLTSRGPSGGARNGVFTFKDFTNVCEITNVRAIGRALGFEFDGGVNGQQLVGCSAEKCQDGMRFTGEVNPISIRSCYFEDISGTAMDFTTPVAHRAVDIDANWFQSVGVGVAGVQMLGGRIGNANYFLKSGTPVVIEDVNSTITVEVRAQRFKGNTEANLPPGYRLGQGIDIRYPMQLFDPQSGRSVVTQNCAGTAPMDMPYAGNMGYMPNDVPFCVHSAQGAGLVIDTRITYNDYVTALFSLKVADGAGVHVLHGRIFGSSVYADSNGGKQIRAGNNNGYLRIVVEGVGGNYRIEGVVRHA
jgi:hypothetical protein